MKFDNMDITIPYNSITRLGAQEDRHITKTRVFMTGIVGLFWKKKYRYTVIEYNDGIQDQTVILDFHKEANKAQKIIYNQMAGARLKQKGLTELKAESEQKGLTEHYKVLEDTNNNKEKEKELEKQETQNLKTEKQQSQEQNDEVVKEQQEFEEFKKWKAQQAEKEKMMMKDSKE